MHELFKILADPTRLRLLRILRQGDYTVQDLMQILSMGQSRISRHLKLLSDAGLLQVEKQGTWHYYRLASMQGLAGDIWPCLVARFDELEGQEQDTAGTVRILAARRQRSQSFFDRHARDWDRMHHDMLSLPEYLPQLLELVPRGGLIVEVGTGTGNLLPHLAPLGEHVVGLDHSPAMIALARDTLARHNLESRAEARLAEMNHLPFTEATVRSVVLNQVLHHAEQPVPVLREIRRVLEPGGRLVVADLTRHDLDWTRERLADQWLGFRREELESWLAETGLCLSGYRELNNPAGQPTVLLAVAEIQA